MADIPAITWSGLTVLPDIHYSLAIGGHRPELSAVAVDGRNSVNQDEKDRKI